MNTKRKTVLVLDDNYVNTLIHKSLHTLNGKYYIRVPQLINLLRKSKASLVQTRSIVSKASAIEAKLNNK